MALLLTWSPQHYCYSNPHYSSETEDSYVNSPFLNSWFRVSDFFKAKAYLWQIAIVETEQEQTTHITWLYKKADILESCSEIQILDKSEQRWTFVYYFSFDRNTSKWQSPLQ